MIGTLLALGVNVEGATEEKEETFGDKLKKLFVRPTPTPKHQKRKRVSATPAAAKSASASPTATPASSDSPPELVVTPAVDSAVEMATPSATVAESPAPMARAGTQYLDAVRPITPPPRRRTTPTTTRRAVSATQSTPFPAMTMISELPSETPASRPVPSLPPLNISSEAPASTPGPTATAQQTPVPTTVKSPAPTGAISIDQISDAASYSPEIRNITDIALELTGRNLSYKYASADPAKGGMDCSGFIYYVLNQSGMKDVPRDAREQYIWTRKTGTFQAVLAQRDDTFELDGLKPGDLLFWASKYGISRDPDITQTMIYLGRDKATNQRLMVGASENRSTKGQRKSGVGVFEFKLGRPAPKLNEESAPIFVGYGHIPGLSEK